MTDLAILVPSRGRPASVARLAEACARTCRTNYVLHFGFDDDDPELDANRAAAAGHHATTLGRMGLVAWTNHLASRYMPRPPAYFASLGDDHLPISDGWDEQLITAVEHMGGGFAYPNDQRRDDIPEAVVVSSGVVRALGWMACPKLDHWYCDNVWADLGRGAGRLAYLPEVIVKHLNPVVISPWTDPGDPLMDLDQTYEDAAQSWDKDLRAYQRWRLHDMRNDIGTVRTCLLARQ